MIRINSAQCTGCESCVDACRAGAISMIDGKARIEPALCKECSACVRVCPQGAVYSDTQFQQNVLPAQASIFPGAGFGMKQSAGRGGGRSFGRGMGQGAGRRPRDGRGGRKGGGGRRR